VVQVQKTPARRHHQLRRPPPGGGLTATVSATFGTDTVTGEGTVQ
jgi:hypothetical protein